MNNAFKIILLATLLVFLNAGFSRGQNLWMDRQGGTAFNLDIRRPLFDTDGENGPSLYTLFAEFDERISSAIQMVCEIPVAYASYSDYDYYGYPTYDYVKNDKHEVSLGNPYLGLRLRYRAGVIEIGGRLPVSGDFNVARELGSLSGVDRLGAFVPEVATFRLAANLGSPSQSEGFVRFGIGASNMVPLEDAGPDCELFGHYGIQAGYDGPRAFAGVAFNGLVWLTESGLEYNERSLHFLDIKGVYKAGRLQPGVYLLMPMDKDFSEVISSVFGLQLAYSLTRPSQSGR